MAIRGSRRRVPAESFSPRNVAYSSTRPRRPWRRYVISLLLLGHWMCRDKRFVVQFTIVAQSSTPNHFATTNQRSTSPCFKSLPDKKMHRLKRSPKQTTLRPSANPQVSTTDSRREASPGLTANFSSNNPFRNRAASPLPSPVTTTFDNIPSTAPERPVSRNPFLDQIQPEGKDTTTLQLRQISPDRELYTMAGRSPPKKPALTGHAVELFVSYPVPSK